jgi:hypothetical protein
VSSMRVEGEDPPSLDMKGFGVWCLGTFWVGDVRCLLLRPAGWGLCVARLLRSLTTMAIAWHPGSPRALCGANSS